MVWYPAHGHRPCEHHGAHAVPAGDVPSPSLGHVAHERSHAVDHLDGVRVVSRHSEQACEPPIVGDAEPVTGSLGYNDHAWVADVVRRLCERPCGVAGGCHDGRPTAVVPETGVGRQGFHLLERAGPDPASSLGVVPCEPDPQVVQPQLLGESLAAEDHRFGLGLKRGPDRQPVVELEHALAVPDVQPLGLVHGPQEALVAVPAGERVPLVHLLPAFQAYQLIISHRNTSETIPRTPPGP